ncbi:MAG: DNA cytosine methyltransferase [Arcobacteraceae bacterium]
MTKKIDNSTFTQKSLFDIANKPKNSTLKAIDLFAGIGGIRLGFQEAFGKNIEFVFASEIDKFAQQTYYANFGEMPNGDITKIDEKDIPSHDIILAGFPCQAFSIAGLRKGFEDTRGTLFFDVARIAAYHKPKIIFLENVKGFVNHDKGNTFKVVKQTLEDLGYKVYSQVLNAKDFGVPQNRERIYIVAFLEDVEFEFPRPLGVITSLKYILENNPNIKSIKRDDIELKDDYDTSLNLLEGLPNRTLQIGKVNKGGVKESEYIVYMDMPVLLVLMVVE